MTRAGLIYSIFQSVASRHRRRRARLGDLAIIPLPGTPAEFGALIAAETEKWTRVVKAGGLSAE